MREQQHVREPTERDAARREAPAPEVARPLDARAVMRLQLTVAAGLATTDPNAIVGLLEEILRTGDR